MRRFKFSLYPVFLLVVVATTAVAQDSYLADWNAFRTKYKFHIQTLAVSPQHADGTRTLIVSEPPPHAVLDGMLQSDSHLRNPRVLKKPIGHDGWVKDVLFELPTMSDPELQTLTLKLNKYLFFTTYKTSVLPISQDVGHVPARFPLDLQVSAAQLRAWVSARSGKWIPLLGDDPETMSQILHGSSGGVFFSSSPGLVVWAFPRREDLSHRQTEAREFTIDSDLILGALGSDSTVAVIGRERIVPCDVVPPLRVETILLLASANGDELAQSYERTNFAAGKFDSKGNADWAPIYLSDELIDTEYGSLLNITDQLLKSWSLNGTIRYENFEYPAPKKWLFSKPLIELLDVPELTFNWNTSGAAYATEDQQTTTLALNRTGALPVSYIPEGHSEIGNSEDIIGDKEDEAYDYFAHMNDPNLVRVVEYASLYQIFRRFKVSAAAPPGVRPPSQEQLTSEIQGKLQAFSELTLDQMKANLKGLMDRNEITSVEALNVVDSAEHLQEVQDLIHQVVHRWGDAGLKELAEMVVSPRANATHTHDPILKVTALIHQLPRAQREAAYDEMSSPAKMFVAIDAPSGILGRVSASDRKQLAMHATAGELAEHSSLVRALTGTSVASLKQAYEASWSRPEVGWVRTPSIVVSYTDEELSSGGHNIDPRVTEFRESSSVAKGTVEVVTEGDKKIILYNPVDERLPRELTPVVGKYGKYLPDDILEKALTESIGDIPVRPTESRTVALGFTEKLKPSLDRGLQGELTASRVAPVGFRTAAVNLTDAQATFVSSLRGRTLTGTVVERRNPASILIYNSNTGHVVEATDISGAIDAIGEIALLEKRQGRNPFFVFRNGFSEAEAEGMGIAARANADADIVVEVEKSSAEEMGALLKEGSLNLQEAEVGDPVAITEAETGAQGVEVTTKIPFRSKVSAFFLKVRVFFRNIGLPLTQMASSVRATVEEVIAKCVTTGEEWSALRIASATNKELRKRFGDNVKVVMHNTQDLPIAERTPIHEPIG